jgi:hypothetical protein
MNDIEKAVQDLLSNQISRSLSPAGMLAQIHKLEGLENYCVWLRAIYKPLDLVVALQSLAANEEAVIDYLVSLLPTGLVANNYQKLREAGLLERFGEFVKPHYGEIASVQIYSSLKHIVIEALRTDSDGVSETVFYGEQSHRDWGSWERAILSQIFDESVLPAVIQLMPREN